MSWIQTSRGRAFDLVNPDWKLVDFDEMADVLARIARFTGHIGGGPYSVAQHSVVGADAVYEETGDRDAAGAFLLHDGHEYLLGDQSRPHQAAEHQVAVEVFGKGTASQLAFVRRELKERADKAIYLAAGFGEQGCPADYRDLVRTFDERMLVTERDQLLGPSPMPWVPSIENAERIRMRGRLSIWTWTKAADEFRARLSRYVPARSPAACPAHRSTLEA